VANPADYLAEPFLKFPKPAFRAKRLIGFDTGKSNLKREHEGWLVEAAHAIPNDRSFVVYIFGYASKLGFRGQSGQQSDASNVTLSFARANKAAMIMELVNPRVSTRVDRFFAKGSQDYSAALTDDSPNWRAVEVHVFLDNAPPPPPGPTPPPPCPGGHRYRKWSVAVVGGFSASPFPGAVIAGNVVAFRREEGAVVHFYVAPGAGGGFSYSGPKLKQILEWIKKLFGGFSASGLSWSTPFTAATPFNFGDLDGATCDIKSLGGGVGPGYQKASISVYGKVWVREASGKCMLAPNSTDFFVDVDVSGKDLQLGIGGSVVGGPLIRVQ
jgi:hypothetical protein